MRQTSHLDTHAQTEFSSELVSALQVWLRENNGREREASLSWTGDGELSPARESLPRRRRGLIQGRDFCFLEAAGAGQSCAIETRIEYSTGRRCSSEEQTDCRTTRRCSSEEQTDCRTTRGLSVCPLSSFLVGGGGFRVTTYEVLPPQS